MTNSSKLYRLAHWLVMPQDPQEILSELARYVEATDEERAILEGS